MEKNKKTGKRKFLGDKNGVFGLTAVQAFFVLLLSVALLGFVIVIIMGSLSSGSNLIIPLSSGTVYNETGAWLNTSNGGGYVLTKATLNGFQSPVILTIFNGTDVVSAGNYTVSNAGLLTNLTVANAGYQNVNVSYNYKYYSTAQNGANSILGNTSIGVSSFFGAINPVYAILGVLVIILVLVVLVRVVSNSPSRGGETPQL